ncbi:MAG: asparaginase [Bdellovibrionales bacterium]|nr:asparaginase [Bdellovibrionales bacterium]
MGHPELNSIEQENFKPRIISENNPLSASSINAGSNVDNIMKKITSDFLYQKCISGELFCIETGGTFSAAVGENGKTPFHQLKSIIEKYIPSIQDLLKLRFPAPGTSEHFGELIDSTNVQPEDWIRLAKIIHKKINEDDTNGIVVTCGTDTMAYAASALSLILENPTKAIVLTGSQRTISEKKSDALINFVEASYAAQMLPAGVYIVFRHRIIKGINAVKVDSRSLDAFRSVGGADVGRIDLKKKRFLVNMLALETQTSKVRADFLMHDKFDNAIKVETIIPGYEPRQLEKVLSDSDIHGVIIQGFGLGGIPTKGKRSLLRILKEYASKKPIVLATQVLNGGTNLDEYEVSVLAKQAGVLSANYLTLETASFALKLLLGQKLSLEELKNKWNQINLSKIEV